MSKSGAKTGELRLNQDVAEVRFGPTWLIRWCVRAIPLRDVENNLPYCFNFSGQRLPDDLSSIPHSPLRGLGLIREPTSRILDYGERAELGVPGLATPRSLTASGQRSHPIPVVVVKLRESVRRGTGGEGSSPTSAGPGFGSHGCESSCGKE